MSNKNHSITTKYKIEKHLTEIDFVLRDRILGENWDENEERYTEINFPSKDSNWSGEAHPIEIDDVISVLKDMKTLGCNYVEIMYHSDHIGYYFNGLDIHRSTDEELKSYNEQIEAAKEKNKQAQIDKLTKELEKLKKS